MKRQAHISLVWLCLSVAVHQATAVAEDDWEALPGPYRGAVSAFAVKDKTIYAASWSGVFRSADGGATWTAANSGLPNRMVASLAVTPLGEIYAGCGDYPRLVVPKGGGVWRSVDGGDSWTDATAGLANARGSAPVWSVAADTRGNVFVNLGGNSLFRRAKGEDSWKAMNSPSGKGIAGVLAVPDGRLLAATDAGLFASTDAGDTWTACASPAKDRVWGLVADGKRLYASTGSGLFISEDSGKSWSANRLTGQNIISLHAAGDKVLVGTGDPRLGSGKVFLSTDDGAAFSQVLPAAGKVIGDVRTVLVVPHGLFASADGTYRSLDGGKTWTEANAGLAVGVDVRSIAFAPNGDLYVSGRGFGAARSKDGGKTWTQVSDGLPGLRAGALGVNAAGEMLLGGYRGAAYRLAGNGNAWTAGEIGRDSTVSRFALSPSGDVLAAMGDSSIWRSTDGGAKFTSVGRVGGLMTSFMQAANGDLYAGMEVSGIHKSTDGGKTWQQVKKNSHNQGAMAFNARGELLVADGVYSEVLWRLAGEEWVKSQKGLPGGASIFAMIVTAGGTVFISDRTSGAYRSTDHGETWEPFRAGFPSYNTDIETLGLDRQGFLYAGSAFGGGVYCTVKPVDQGK